MELEMVFGGKWGSDIETDLKLHRKAAQLSAEVARSQTEGVGFHARANGVYV
jgi:hypothetical protein